VTLPEEWKAADAAERIAAYLGAKEDWDSEVGIDIANILYYDGGFPHPGDPQNTEYYRQRAKRLLGDGYDQ
jgi:hypothetical protein